MVPCKGTEVACSGTRECAAGGCRAPVTRLDIASSACNHPVEGAAVNAKAPTEDGQLCGARGKSGRDGATRGVVCPRSLFLVGLGTDRVIGLLVLRPVSQ